MEQKKILWIVAAVSVFVLVIFGFALVICSPPRTAETERQTASALIPGRLTETARRNAAGEDSATVDPDSWVRSPETAPGLDAEIVPAGEAESLTAITAAYVAGTDGSAARDEESTARETINVRDLASRFPQEERSAREQAVLPAQDAATPSQNEQPAQTAAAGTTGAEPARTEVRQAARQSTPAVAEPVRRTVIEYWIQTGSFSNKLNAESARKMLAERYLNAEIFTKEINGSQTYRVRVGPYADKAEADYWLGTISEAPEFSGSYVSRVTAQR